MEPTAPTVIAGCDRVQSGDDNNFMFILLANKLTNWMVDNNDIIIETCENGLFTAYTADKVNSIISQHMHEKNRLETSDLHIVKIKKSELLNNFFIITPRRNTGYVVLAPVRASAVTIPRAAVALIARVIV